MLAIVLILQKMNNTIAYNQLRGKGKCYENT